MQFLKLPANPRKKKNTIQSLQAVHLEIGYMDITTILKIIKKIGRTTKKYLESEK